MPTNLFAVKVGQQVIQTDLTHADARALAAATPGSRIVPNEILVADRAAGQTAVGAAAALDGIDTAALQFAVTPAFAAAAAAVAEFDGLPANERPAALHRALRAILQVEAERPRTIAYDGRISLGSLATCLRWAESAAGVSFGYEYPENTSDCPTIGQVKLTIALAAWFGTRRQRGETVPSLSAITEYNRR